MGDRWLALATAVVGVVGTLGAALLTQRRADRTKRLELAASAEQQREERQHSEQVRQAEREETLRREHLELRRTCYIALNTASRQYLTAQVNLLHALRNGIDANIREEELDTRRTAHRDSYAEAQMIGPAAVLDTAGQASRHLNSCYGALKEAAATPAASRQTGETFDEDVATAWRLLSTMRHTMRRDLGIEDNGTRP